jgi:hypothetical protein
MKKNMNEQSSPIGTHHMGPMWWQEFGCIMDGIDGIRKVQNDEGTLFVLSKDGKEYALLNPNNKPDPALVEKVQSVNPNIKRFGKAMNIKDKNEALVYYCHGPIKGGIRVIGDNYTVEPPRQAKPAQPAQQSKAPTAPAATAAPVNEQFENKVLSEQIIRIKDVMGKLL